MGLVSVTGGRVGVGRVPSSALVRSAGGPRRAWREGRGRKGTASEGGQGGSLKGRERAGWLLAGDSSKRDRYVKGRDLGVLLLRESNRALG